MYFHFCNFLMPNTNGPYLGLNTHHASHLWITSPLPYQLGREVRLFGVHKHYSNFLTSEKTLTSQKIS